MIFVSFLFITGVYVHAAPSLKGQVAELVTHRGERQAGIILHVTSVGVRKYDEVK